MANITAAQVNELRNMTGVGLMKCKEALIEADGDLEKAGVILREKGLAKQAKKASRVAAEGVAYATVDSDKKVGVLVEVNSETDFAAKSDKFMDFVKTVAQTAIATIGTSAVLGDVNWLAVVSAAALAGVLSLLTSVAGLPEVKEE